MFGKKTDRDWEKYGADDPYFGVIAQLRYRRENLTDEQKSEFFASGSRRIEHVLRSITTHIDPTFQPSRALDFGCGVGRLVLPLAQVSNDVVGLDVSRSMLAEAARNCESLPPGKVSFVESDDELSGLTGTFDLIHSFIVFQHVPVNRGTRIFGRLLSRLEPGGVAVLHFTYDNRDRLGMRLLRKTVHWARAHLPLLNRLFNYKHRRRADLPVIQMNHYDLNRLLRIVQQQGFRAAHLELTDHAGELGVVLYIQRPRTEQRAVEIENADDATQDARATRDPTDEPVALT